MWEQKNYHNSLSKITKTHKYINKLKGLKRALLITQRNVTKSHQTNFVTARTPISATSTQISSKTKCLYINAERNQLTKQHVFKAHQFNPRRQLLQPVYLDQHKNNRKEPIFNISKLRPFLYFRNNNRHYIFLSIKQNIYYLILTK